MERYLLIFERCLKKNIFKATHNWISVNSHPWVRKKMVLYLIYFFLCCCFFYYSAAFQRMYHGSTGDQGKGCNWSPLAQAAGRELFSVSGLNALSMSNQNICLRNTFVLCAPENIKPQSSLHQIRRWFMSPQQKAPELRNTGRVKGIISYIYGLLYDLMMQQIQKGNPHLQQHTRLTCTFLSLGSFIRIELCSLAPQTLVTCTVFQESEYNAWADTPCCFKFLLMY